MLARELIAGGHAVRGTTRSVGRVADIERVGAEPFVGDPDRVATIARAFDHASIACVLLGSAQGDAAALQALHGTRLEMLLARTRFIPAISFVEQPPTYAETFEVQRFQSSLSAFTLVWNYLAIVAFIFWVFFYVR